MTEPDTTDGIVAFVALGAVLLILLFPALVMLLD